MQVEKELIQHFKYTTNEVCERLAIEVDLFGMTVKEIVNVLGNEGIYISKEDITKALKMLDEEIPDIDKVRQEIDKCLDKISYEANLLYELNARVKKSEKRLKRWTDKKIYYEDLLEEAE